MAPLSMLPGRIRLEDRSLVGNVRDCRGLEASVRCMEGVFEASVNPRTGRITVKYDETRTDGKTLMEEMLNNVNNSGYGGIIHSRPSVNTTRPPAFNGSNAAKSSESALARHAVIDILAKAVLPKPLNVLLPLALHAIRK